MKRTLLLAVFVLLPMRLHAAAGDEFWDVNFGVPGVDGYGVGAISFQHDNVFVAGTFVAVGGVPATNIASWNGETWTNVGAGIGKGLNQTVRGLVFADQKLYAGGFFTNAGNSTAFNVASWDGTSWMPLGSGVDGIVSALATDSSNVYVGGSFTMAGGIRTANVARWDGQQWWPLGDGVRGVEGGIGAVDALIIGRDGLYVGGSFTNASGVSATNIARWDGTNWYRLANGIPARVRSLAASGSKVFAAGDPFRQNETNSVYVSEWTGSEWIAIGTGSWPGGGGVVSFSVCGTDLYASGAGPFAGMNVNGIARWDGARWYPLGSGFTQGAAGAMACTGSELFLGGQFVAAGGKPSTNIALWHIPHSVNVTRTDNQVRVSWPATGTNFLLEAASPLWPTNFTEVAQPREIQNGECVVLEPLSTTNRFYRLRRKPW